MTVIASMLRYDFKRFTRDRFIFVMTLVSLVIYSVGGQFIPDDIAPKWRIAAVGEFADYLDTTFKEKLKNEKGKRSVSAEVVRFETEAAMKEAFVSGEDTPWVGIFLESDARAKVARGEKPTARVYVDESKPPTAQKSARAIGDLLVRSFVIPKGQEKPPAPLVGPSVEPVPFGQRSRTLLTFMVLMLEMMALASLVAKEISGGVVHAVLTTTVSLPRYFFAKVLFGVLLSFSQAMFLALVLGVLAIEPLVVTALLFCASTMFTGFGIIAGTRGKHLMEVMMWSMLFIVPAFIPSIAAMLPGTAPLGVQILPTYPIVQGLLAAGQSTPLVASWIHAVWAAGWTVVVLSTSFLTLRRRVK